MLYLILLGFLVDLYARITLLSETVEARALTWILLAGGSILYIFISPYFFHSLAGLSPSPAGRIIFSAVDAVVCLGAAANIAVPSSAPIAIGLSGILFGMIAFGILFIAVHLHGIGRKIRNLFAWPALRLAVTNEQCRECGSCSRHFPMSIDVMELVQEKNMETEDCILCGSCVDACPKTAIRYSFSSGH